METWPPDSIHVNAPLNLIIATINDNSSILQMMLYRIVKLDLSHAGYKFAILWGKLDNLIDTSGEQAVQRQLSHQTYDKYQKFKHWNGGKSQLVIAGSPGVNCGL